MFKILFFLIGSGYFSWISRRSLRNWRSHGFYRFFAFEGILALLLINYPYWFVRPFSARQLLSWVLLASSIYFVFAGLWLLRDQGGSRRRSGMPENFAFENTVHLVRAGIYRYVRHPMYSSLLLLAWGAFCKHPAPLPLLLSSLVTIFLVATAKSEEVENIQFFGERYRSYQGQSKMFFPYLL